MNLKLTTLIENQENVSQCLIGEHGLSMLIEIQGHKLLFDTGQTGAFIDNVKKLGIDLHDIDHLIVSHGHYDHSSGVPRLLKEYPGIPDMIVGEGFFAPKYKRIEPGAYKYNGNPMARETIDIPVIEVTEDTYSLWEGVTIHKNFNRSCDYEELNPMFYLKRDNGYVQDTFSDEIALAIHTDKGLVVIVGCSHVGISNILETICRREGESIYALVGGTHLMGASKDRVNSTIDTFRQMHIKEICVSHCTGAENIDILSKEFGEHFINNGTGNVINL